MGSGGLGHQQGVSDRITIQSGLTDNHQSGFTGFARCERAVKISLDPWPDGLQRQAHRFAGNRSEALQACDPAPDLIIADHHLGRGENGLDVSDAVREALGVEVPILVVTADRDEALGRRIAERGERRLFKPVKPAALRAVMKFLLRG